MSIFGRTGEEVKHVVAFPHHAVYVISVAAELAGVHPQTLRIYERKGLLEPARTSGGAGATATSTSRCSCASKS